MTKNDAVSWDSELANRSIWWREREIIRGLLKYKSHFYRIRILCLNFWPNTIELLVDRKYRYAPTEVFLQVHSSWAPIFRHGFLWFALTYLRPGDIHASRTHAQFSIGAGPPSGFLKLIKYHNHFYKNIQWSTKPALKNTCCVRKMCLHFSNTKLFLLIILLAFSWFACHGIWY